jgi:hypothetical protein
MAKWAPALRTGSSRIRPVQTRFSSACVVAVERVRQEEGEHVIGSDRIGSSKIGVRGGVGPFLDRRNGFVNHGSSRTKVLSSKCM